MADREGEVLDCERHRVKLRDGTNFYFMMGDTLVLPQMYFNISSRTQ